MPNENDSNFGTAGTIGAAVTILSPFYAWSSMSMLRSMPTEGFKVPWTKWTLWSPHPDVARLARTFEGRAGIFFTGRNTRRAARTIYAQGLALRRAGFNVGSRAGIKAVARKGAYGLATRYLVGAVAGTALGAVAALDAITIPAAIGIGIYRAASAKVNQYKGLELGGYFPDTGMAQTSRQRALQAITASQLQARSAIGNEAMLFHR